MTAGTAGCALPGRRGDNSFFSYLLNVEPAAPIEDVRLYVPTPVQHGEAVLSEIVTEMTERQSGWAVDIVDTEQGPMLEIEAEELSPADGPYDMWIDVDVEEEIDTRAALANEPTLQPKHAIEQVECDFPHPDRWADRLRCYTYETMLYGEYPGETATSVFVSLDGSNEWFDSGWTGNEYGDTVTGTVVGDGWSTASGRLREGVGRY